MPSTLESAERPTGDAPSICLDPSRVTTRRVLAFLDSGDLRVPVDLERMTSRSALH
jgi:hypothetical protein